MEIVLAFIFGMVVGLFSMLGLLYYKAVHGYFSLRQVDPENPEMFEVKISLPQNVYLLDKKRIILRHFEQSQK